MHAVGLPVCPLLFSGENAIGSLGSELPLPRHAVLGDAGDGAGMYAGLRGEAGLCGSRRG